MKKALIVIIFLFYCCEKKDLKKTDCSYQNDTYTLGSGLISWNYKCDDIIFFQDSLLRRPISKVNFCNKGIPPICPLLYKPDYGIIYFVVKNKKSNYYEIIYNTNKIAFLPKDNIFQYISWEKFLTEEVTGIKKLGKNTMYSVLSVNGDSILIKDMDTEKKESFKWKENDKLTIELISLM
ncbi:hypothetical protein ACQ1Q5_06915 [Ornithobacterium rhinotracheale]